MAELDQAGPTSDGEVETAHAVTPFVPGSLDEALPDGVTSVPPATHSVAPVVDGEPFEDPDIPAGAVADEPVEESPAQTAEDEPADHMAEVREQLARLLDETENYHARAAQRESVIDNLHGELEQLRRGERRSLLRPLVTEICRLRDDLLNQAATLPEPFDAARAADLLRSYADSLEIALEDNGITSYTPGVGEAFEARQHRAACKVPTRDADAVGTIAAVISSGYRDVEANVVIATARVAVHVADETESEPAPARDDTATAAQETPASVSSSEVPVSADSPATASARDDVILDSEEPGPEE
jgi:molecular chaperone GrpE